MKLGEMTWPDVKALDKTNLVPVYPIASFEQHGPHLPFLTDTMETQEVVDRLERRLPDDVICLPTQWLGYSFHHTRFAGSITATSDTHINLITETVSCLIEAGFPKVLIVNGHGGNQADMSVALQKLKEHHEESRVFGASYWKVADRQLDEIREAGPHGWGHAGEMETSMMLVIRPDLVKADLPHRDGTHPESQYGERVSQFLRMDEMTELGIYGDPKFGSSEKGERMLEAIADSLAEVILDIQGGRL
ncbi:MAG: creatininase family protein [Candidatus Latescibacterota bacterium]|nr:creatininase family protein [Candidatus Latescibacterota bacterium]